MSDPQERISTYKEFWPFYLKEHSKRATRVVHLTGTLLAVLFSFLSFLTSHSAYIPVALVIGYGFAWYAHFFIERNRPATFKYPLWSFISDFRMAFLILTGRL